jgi:tripartite-type tricarboxylate transporter receptor subunit TctC
LTDSLGQSFIVENRPGATGNVSLEAVARAPADGYTLFVGNVSTNTINENTFASTLTIKPSRDLVGIAKLVEIPHIIAASTAFPANTIPELIEAKKTPSTTPRRSQPPPRQEKFACRGIQLTHVRGRRRRWCRAPRQRNPGRLINLPMLPHVRAGKVKALATTAPQRLPELPNVPTMAELGYAGIGTNAWQGLFAPAATPKPVVDKIYGAVAAVLTKADMKDNLGKQMMAVELSKSPQEFTELVKKETQGWGDFLREAKIKIE